jgi:hypothetical protein
MNKSKPRDEYFNHEEVYKNILNLNRRLRKIIEHKKESEFSDIDLEISGLMHQMTYFSTLVQVLYPLERTYHLFRLSPKNPNPDNVIEKHVEAVDFNCRKSFLVLTAFSFETLLGVISKTYSISLDGCGSMDQKYLRIMDFFDIEREEYQNLIKIFYYTRNTLHSGTHVTRDSSPLTYKGKTFFFEIGQSHVEHTTWNYFTYFAHEIVSIFEKIYKSQKFNK